MSFASASQQRSLYTSYHVDATAHAVARQSGVIVNRDRASLVRSTATARLWQRKGRCIRVKLACKMTRGPPRLHSPAFSRPSGVNRDTRRPLGTRRDACGCRRDICICLIKTGFDRSVGGAVWALTADPCPRESASSDFSDHRAANPHRCGCVEAKPRQPEPLCSSSEEALLRANAPLRHRNRCGCGETKPRRTQSLCCS